MSKLIIANWKMNPASIAEAVTLAKETDANNLIVCPPFVFLKAVGEVLQKANLGAQDLFWNGPTGAFTGEVSAAELKDLGVEYVIIGHSERRINVGETNEMVAKKVATALKEGLIPILCIGETLEEKKTGLRDEVLKKQLEISLSQVSQLSDVYVAYEPIWAISTNPNAEPDRPENTIEVINFLKKDFPVKFLYGGSVNANNAELFLQPKEIEGALVGGASLKKDQIKKIVEVAAKFK